MVAVIVVVVAVVVVVVVVVVILEVAAVVVVAAAMVAIEAWMFPVCLRQYIPLGAGHVESASLTSLIHSRGF